MSTTLFYKDLVGDGKVGIGSTATPTANLQVMGNIYASNSLTTTNVFANTLNFANASATGSVTASTFYGVLAGSNTISSSNLLVASGLPASIVQGSNVFVFSNASGGANVMVMNSLGRVGVGTTSPATALDVYTGTINAATVTASSATLTSLGVLTGNITTANIVSLNVTGDANIAQNLRVLSNLYTNNLIMGSNLSTDTGYGNVYVSANLVVNGNVFSLNSSGGSGTSQGITYTLGGNYTLGAAFATGTAGPSMNAYHINMSSFTAEAVAAVSAFSAASGMFKFATAGLYQVQMVLVGDQSLVKVGVGSASLGSFPPGSTATSGYLYVYNVTAGTSPSTVITIPLNITDISKWYYLDAFFSIAAGDPTLLYPTGPPGGSSAGSNYGTFVQVSPFGNYLSSATGIASALLTNCSSSSNLSGVYSSNAYRIAMTSSNGWTVNGTSTSLAITTNGNFQVNQTGIYEVNMCLNTVGNTPVQFQIGSLATDALSPSSTTPEYLYTYAPMYTQDPTTVIQLPLNITNISNVYFIECSFPGTVTGNVALTQTSTFVSIKPIGGYLNTGTNPWIQQGSFVYYNGGNVGIGTSSPATALDVYTGTINAATVVATSGNIATMNVGYLTVNSAVVYGTSTLNVYGTSNLTNIFATTGNIATMNVGYLTVNSAVVYGTSTLNVYGTSNLTNVTVTNTIAASTITATSANSTVLLFDTLAIPFVTTSNLTVSNIMSPTDSVKLYGNLYVSNSMTTTNIPLTTTTSLINNYLSNAAQITSNTGTGSITQALRLPGTANSGVIWQSGGHSVAVANLALSNLFIEAWINPVVGSTLPVLSRKLGAGNDLVFYATSAGILTASVYNTSGAIAATASNSTALVSGTWYHVSASYQRTSTTAGTLRVFVNGGVGGTTGTVSTQPRVQPSANVMVGFEPYSLTGQNLFVAVAAGATVAASSTDGIFWSPRTLPSGSWTSVTVNPNTGIFATVSEGTATAASSTDGINWIQRTLPSSSTWYGVACNPTTGIFVAVANGSTAAASSTDGINWTARTLPSSSGWRGTSVNPTTGVFVIVGYNSTAAASSTDGFNWVARTLPSSTQWQSTACNPNTGIFAAVGGNTFGASSTDGFNWIQRTFPSALNWCSVTCNPTTGIFAAVAQSSASAASSTDGFNWTARTLPSNASWFTVTCNPVTGVFVALVFGSDTAASSTDGFNWTARTASSSAFWYYVTSQYQVATSASFTGNVADVRVFSGSLGVPTATYTTNTAPFTQSAPSYATGMSAVGTANTVLALQSQYFPGASTSPYGPCLTLPGTVGSYYRAASSSYDTNWRTSGFCLEMWINYASFANATNGGTAQSSPLTWSHGPGGGTYDWGFGATNVGGACLFLGGPRIANTAASVITTGSWNHIMVQGNGSNVYMAINGTFQPLNATYSPTGGNNTIAPTQPSVLSITSLNPIYVGSALTLSPPNFAIAKARLTFGTAGTPTLGNVYSSGNFTPNPNFATVPVGAVVAWSLDSQYALPTYPSFFDVPALPQQTSSYGAEPVVVGGVTSNVLSPYSTTYPQLDSIRFDGTGYIDYGNAASSVMTSNIWASPWTIEAWVYLASAPSNYPGFISFSNASTYDWALYVNAGNPAQVSFAYGKPTGTPVFNAGSLSVSPGTWTHVAATYDGTRSNVYVGGSLSNSMVATTTNMTFNPSFNLLVGSYQFASQPLNGNLADVRVSNVARYSGTTYVVPSAPFTTDSNTLLLLKSLAGQTGTTLEIQGRGLNAVSLGATRSVQSYPPAPMSSYLLDTTSNALVTYGQGKYVASASTELSSGYVAWYVFNKDGYTSLWNSVNTVYSTSSPYSYTGSVTTVDTLGNSYAGEWVQVQVPVSILIQTYSVTSGAFPTTRSPGKFFILGSRDGINWTLVDTRTVTSYPSPNYLNTYTLNTSQAYNYYRFVINQTIGGGGTAELGELTLNGTEESLCITSDSKVGVGIANPQRSLEVAGDLVVGGTISGGAGMGSFRNRIINGDMRIAQRGTSFTTTTASATYTIDRWLLFTGGTTLTEQRTLTASDSPYQAGLANSLRMTSAPGTDITAYEVVQRIEGYNFADFNWGTSFAQPATLSFWFRSLCTQGSVFSFAIRSGTASYSYVNSFMYTNPSTWQYYTFTIPPPPNGTSGISTTTSSAIAIEIGSYHASTSLHGDPGIWVAANKVMVKGATNVLATAGNFIEFTGIQLERGTVATPFEVRNYAQELQLCQRYMFQLTYQDTSPCYQRTSVLAMFLIRFPVTMRSAVNPTLSGTFNCSIAATDTTISSISAPGGGYGASATGSQYMFPSTQTLGQAGQIWMNSPGAYIRYDAEL